MIKRNSKKTPSLWFVFSIIIPLIYIGLTINSSFSQISEKPVDEFTNNSKYALSAQNSREKNLEILHALGFTKPQNLDLLAANLDKIFTHPRKEVIFFILLTQDRYQDQRVDIIMRILKNG